MTPPPTTYNKLQDLALDHCKIGGDPQLALALSVLTLAEAVRGQDDNGVATAIDGLGTSIEAAAL